uniref:Uncharacterized protein n=1 Tax=Rhizophora mucronata TaxID=61149 RepID=A0A2P2N5K0_RHIMU
MVIGDNTEKVKRLLLVMILLYDRLKLHLRNQGLKSLIYYALNYSTNRSTISNKRDIQFIKYVCL